MNLTCFPNEILWLISSFLPYQRDRLALLMTNLHLHSALIGSLYYFDGQYHHGAALSQAVEKNNLCLTRELLNGLHASSKEHHAPFSPTDLQTEDEEAGCMIRRRDADYWEDVYTHHLYRQGYSVQGILNIQHALVKAISSGSSDMVILLLDGGARANFYRGPRAQSPPVRLRSRRWQYVSIDPPPLCVAVKCGRVDLVRVLLQRGAKPELYSPSPLYQAVEDDQRDIAAVLLQHRVRPQDTALKLAVLRGNQAMAQQLLDNGLNAAEFGGPALYAAMKRNDRGMVHLLESHGATIAGVRALDKENWNKEDRDNSDDEYGICRRKVPPSYIYTDEIVEEEDEEEDAEDEEDGELENS